MDGEMRCLVSVDKGARPEVRAQEILEAKDRGVLGSKSKMSMKSPWCQRMKGYARDFPNEKPSALSTKLGIFAAAAVGQEDPDEPNISNRSVVIHPP